MAEQPGKGKAAHATAPAVAETARSVDLASRGIRTAVDAGNFLSALATDVMTEKVPLKTAGTVCNVLGKLFKVVDMNQKYAKPGGTAEAPLVLANPDQTPDARAERRKQLLAELESLEEPAPAAAAG